MGLFINNLKSRGLLEADINGQPGEGSEDPTPDYTAEENTEPAQDQPQENAPEEGGNNEQPQENEPQQPPEGAPPEDEPPPDYTEMADDGSGEGAPPDDGSAPPQEEPESEVDDIKQREEELYNELSPEQLDIKHRELKNQYLAMYDMVVSIIDRIGDVNVAEENIHTVEYVSNNLSKLKDMLTDYVDSVYQTKSYIENSINYNRFLAVLNGINKILEEMNSKNDEK